MRTIREVSAFAVLILGLTGVLTVAQPARQAYAACYCGPGCCTQCPPGDCSSATSIIENWHEMGELAMMNYITLSFYQHKNWLTNTFFLDEVRVGMMNMANYMSAVGMYQVFLIGSFLDAKHQLETQRLFKYLEFEANKDYQPSEDFCWFGTNSRSLAASERKGQLNTLALNSRQMSRHLGTLNASGAEGGETDKAHRWEQFKGLFCDPADNNRTTTAGTGLASACGVGGGQTEYINADIDYTRFIDDKRTLDVAFDTGSAGVTNDEETVIAMGNNLYGNNVLARQSREMLKSVETQHLYLALRAVAAKRNVAETSYNAIVGMKSAGTSTVGADDTANFLGAILTEMGVPAGEVYQIIGEKPSYYAQLELLAKKIYQNPDFYTNLYDKPANVDRKGVALKAIGLMLDRAIYESQLRQEMVLSVLLASRQRDEFREVNKDLGVK